MWGNWAQEIVGVAVMISSLGALNGWTLLMGQVPMAAAQDKLFPALFGRVSSRGVPAVGVVFSAVLATLLVLIQAAGSSGFAAFYSLVVGLATMTAVVPYAFCALSVGLVAARSRGGHVPHVTAVEWIAFVFSMFTLYGCGPTPVLYGFVLLMLGVPVYVWQVRQRAAAA
jgi:arginine:agmatine antiporter